MHTRSQLYPAPAAVVCVYATNAMDLYFYTYNRPANKVRTQQRLHKDGVVYSAVLSRGNKLKVNRKNRWERVNENRMRGAHQPHR